MDPQPQPQSQTNPSVGVDVENQHNPSFRICDHCNFTRNIRSFDALDDDNDDDDDACGSAGQTHSIETVFSQLAKDVRALWIPSSPAAGGVENNEANTYVSINEVPVLDEVPTPFEFLQEYVQLNRPVIIRGLIDHWEAMKLWKDVHSLSSLVGDEDGEITVDVTPNGKGDCVVRVNSGDESKLVFVKPEERRMKFSEFIKNLSNNESMIYPSQSENAQDSWVIPSEHENQTGKQYYSHQNDCFRSPLEATASTLLKHIAPDENGLPLGNICFNGKPEAVNLWIGDGKVVSSCHKDPYENLYSVVTGEKHFVLLPPCDGALFLEEAKFPVGKYRWNEETRKWDVDIQEHDHIHPWISIDPATGQPTWWSSSELQSEQHKDELRKYGKNFKHASPIHCIVRPGETLYLPSCWYHRVTQKGITIAVNYWYDMRFEGGNYAYFNFCKNVHDLLQNSSLKYSIS